MIDNDNFSFLLDIEIDWEKEISEFFHKGGNGEKLCWIFIRTVYVYSSKLEGLQYKKLAIIFKIFVHKCPRDLRHLLDKKFNQFASERGLNLPSTDFYDCAKSAQDLAELKQFDEAQAKVQEGLNKLPNQINLLQIANDVYRASGNLEKSLEYANSLILHHPNDWNGYGRSAQDLLALKRFDEAKSKVQEGLDRFPNQLNLLRIAADIYRALGNREKSLEYAESIIFHFPNDYWNGYYSAAHDLIALKRFDEAQSKVQEWLNKLPNQIVLLRIANDVYRASGNREKSLEYAESLTLNHPTDWNGYGRSAQDLAALKRFDEAQARIQEGLNKLPNQINLLQIANDIAKALGKPG